MRNDRSWEAAERILAHAVSDQLSRLEQINAESGLVTDWLPVAEGRVWPTIPGIDEPLHEAEQRWERARVVVTRLLLLVYRRQIDEQRIDERLRRFFAEHAEQHIWRHHDPVTALRKFLGPPRRGAPKRNAARDANLAAEVQELRDSGITIDEACLAVYERIQTTDDELDPRTLRNIYLRETKHRVGKATIEFHVRLNALLKRLGAAESP